VTGTLGTALPRRPAGRQVGDWPASVRCPVHSEAPVASAAAWPGTAQQAVRTHRLRRPGRADPPYCRL